MKLRDETHMPLQRCAQALAATTSREEAIAFLRRQGTGQEHGDLSNIRRPDGSSLSAKEVIALRDETNMPLRLCAKALAATTTRHDAIAWLRRQGTGQEHSDLSKIKRPDGSSLSAKDVMSLRDEVNMPLILCAKALAATTTRKAAVEWLQRQGWRSA